MIAQGLRRMEARARHRAYLNSPGWRALRSEALERDGYRCRLCSARRRLQVHHRRYPRPWEADRVENLTTLCAGCHERHHRGAAWTRPIASLIVLAALLAGLIYGLG